MHGRSATVPQPGQSAADVIEQRAALWQRKPLTREVYRRYFGMIERELSPGVGGGVAPVTIEIGGGSGMSREFLRGVTVTDVVPSPHVDLVADAMQLPFAEASVDNLFMVDVLHHLPYPARFFREAARVLRRPPHAGRLVMLEPYISPMSRLVFRLAHPEPVDLSIDPLPAGDEALFDSSEGRGGAFASNQAIPTLLFRRHAARFSAQFPELRIRTNRLESCFAYPLSGGFSGPNIVPRLLFPLVFAIEGALSPLGPLLAFRILVTLERT